MRRLSSYVLAISILGSSPAMAADTSATVTESVNQVVRGSAQTTATQPAGVGTSVADGGYLKTGVKSRAELKLADESITRVGSNTIFNYSVANNEIDLQAGTLLFSKPKDGKEMIIKTATVTAAIVGTTGFMQLHGKDFIFGIIEGHARLSTGKVSYKVSPGEIMKVNAGAAPQLFSYNLPVFLKTSPLITKFSHPLPNQPFIDAEVARYNALVVRGFIQPVGQSFYLSDLGGSVPIVPIVPTDSAGNALHQFITPPPVTPPLVVVPTPPVAPPSEPPSEPPSGGPFGGPPP